MENFRGKRYKREPDREIEGNLRENKNHDKDKRRTNKEIRIS